MEKRTVYRLPIVTCSFEGPRSVNCTMDTHVHVCIISTSEHVEVIYMYMTLYIYRYMMHYI